MVMVAILITVLLGMAAMSIDLSRMLVMKEQLQSSADAAALAAAMELSHQRLDRVVSTAVDYGRRNHVETLPPTLDDSDVEVGLWDYAARSFEAVPPARWATTPVNAVRVTSSHTASYTFGGIFNEAPGALKARTTAAVGYVSDASCVKPWAMSYQELLDALFGPGVRSAQSYDLQPQDIGLLASVGVLKGNTTRFAPGDIGELRLGGSGGYSHNIRQCSDVMIRPGETVDAEPGAGSGQTHDALRQFCDAHGGTSGGGSGNGAFTCLGEPKVKVVLWDRVVTNGKGKGKGGGAIVGYHVKYIGAVAITGYSPSSPFIKGYFTALASDGAFSTTPSPLTKVVLVK